MNEALRGKDVHAVCLETAKYFLSKEGVAKFLQDVLVFYQNELLWSKNTYLLEFVERKRFEVLNKRERVQRLSAIELAVLLATCDRPEKSEAKRGGAAKYTEDALVKELRNFMEGKDFDPEGIERCVRTLAKPSKEDSREAVEKLWSVAARLSKVKAHVRLLREHWNLFDEKRRAKFAPDILVECFKTIYESGSYVRDTHQYRPIVVQCMLKAEYLFESIGVVDCGERVYVTCLYHLPKKSTSPVRRTCKQDEFEPEDMIRSVDLS